MPEALLKIGNCMDCPYHIVIRDPDPYDSFNADDEAVLCRATTKNSSYDPKSPYIADQQNDHECVTVSCRPYNKRRECGVPVWCPLLPNPDEKKTKKK